MMANQMIEGAFGMDAPPSLAKTSGHLVLTIVMSVLKSSNGIVPKELWGLSRGLDLIAPRGFVLEGDESYKCYWERLTEAGCYPIVHLRTHNTFNKPIIIYEGIRSIAFGESFDYPLLIPLGVEKLKFGPGFNHSILFPPGLSELEFSANYCNFNHPVVLPDTLKKLTLSGRFNHPIILPDNLEWVELGYSFNQAVILPAALKVLHVYHANHFNSRLQLGGHLEELHLGDNWNLPLILPDSLHTLVVGSGFRNSITFGTGLLILTWGPNYALPPLPKTLIELRLGSDFLQHHVELAEGVEVVKFLGKHSHPLVIPSTLKSISFDKVYELPLVLPSGCARHDPPRRRDSSDSDY